jgi:hypothetical protein
VGAGTVILCLILGVGIGCWHWHSHSHWCHCICPHQYKGNTLQSPTNTSEHLRTHPNIHKHVRTSVNNFANSWITLWTLKHLWTYQIWFESPLHTSSCLWNIVVCFIPYSDICASFLNDPHHPGDHLSTCILTLETTAPLGLLHCK